MLSSGDGVIEMFLCDLVDDIQVLISDLGLFNIPILGEIVADGIRFLTGLLQCS